MLIFQFGTHLKIDFYSGRTRPLVVRFGEHDITTSSESRSFDREIQRYKIHERYDRYVRSLNILIFEYFSYFVYFVSL